ncbi:hypothetical protein DPEC_G00145540 [Dallia pectoralis]|uniref:Uncharacterized protein n=1 Tax=Dallia pectoralis TaxID=75939 RepID=A0ACC2GPJ6_DALPE|nr:hypothetical protein DPEC_G00145540 [Dallia pectoralis]
MLRLLFLGLMLTLQGSADTVDFEPSDGSGNELVDDDEDDRTNKIEESSNGVILGADKTTGETEDGFTTIIIVAAVGLVALSVVAIVATVLIRRHMNNRSPGVYSVPTEQGHKGMA